MILYQESWSEAVKLCGKQLIVYKNAEGETLCHHRCSSKKSKDCLSEAFARNAHVLETLAAHCLPHANFQVLHCYTEYHPEGDSQLCCAHPNYNVEPWLDHALVSWKDDEGGTILHPSCLHAFIDLHNALSRSSIIAFPHSRQGGPHTKPGFYAIIELYDFLLPPLLLGRTGRR